MIVVPKAFIALNRNKNNEQFSVLIGGLNNVILKKVLRQPAKNNQRYISCSAVTIVHHGYLVVKTAEGKQAIVNAGQMVFLPKGLYLLSDIVPNKGSFDATVLFFDDTIINMFLDENKNDIRSTSSNDKLWIQNQPDRIKLFITHLEELYGGGEPSNFSIIEHKLKEFLHLLLTSEVGSSFIETVNQRSIKDKINIKQFMGKHYDKSLKIDDYAYLTGRSIASFHRDFKRIFQMAPKQWLIERRLQKAKTIMEKNHQLSVTHVAYQVGYQNPSNFIKAFQNRFGTSPKQYQINCREQLWME